MKMTLKSLVAASLLMLVAAPAINAQGRKNLRINEVMVVNDSSIVDDFGRRSAWIELINPNHAPINIASVYLTDDLAQPTKYFVPTGDVRTKVEKQQTVVFQADNDPNAGTFHLNFTLTPGQDNFIAVYDADGVNLIDSVTVPASLPAGCTWARAVDAHEGWEVRDNSSKAKAITPGAFNVIREPNNKVAKFKEFDKYGFAMSLIGMAIVFSALLVLSLCFYALKGIFFSSKTKKEDTAPAPAPVAVAAATSADDEVAAAIAMALHEHLNMHDDLPTALTITSNSASAWSNKTAQMRELPNKK